MNYIRISIKAGLISLAVWFALYALGALVKLIVLALAKGWGIA